MLQPEQIKRVEQMYPSEIADLRLFFTCAGIETENANALPVVADRLAADRTFQRDLCSHVWVLLHDYPQISYADLLGTLAIAAAGSNFAATARDSDSHDLLRFVMEARDSLKNGPIYTNDAPVRSANTSIFGLPASVEPDPRDAATDPVYATGSDREQPQFQRRTAVLMLSVLCIAAAVTAAFWLRERTPAGLSSVPSQPAAQQTLEQRGSEAPQPVPRSTESAGQDSAAAYPATRQHEPAKRTPEAVARVAKLHKVDPASSEPIAATKPLQAPVSVLRGRTNQAATEDAPVSRTAASPVLSSRRIGRPVAIPSAVLSQQIGARTLSPDYALEDRSYDARYPRLLRRRPLLPLAEESSDNSDLAALNSPPALFRDATTSTAASAIVRPVSLGTMAANVLYSPAPAYPPAAAAAHVQGEVRVQAEVDRDGNVAFARVISGPALLRDAAVDAVQRWHYRPYLSAGKPVAMSATAVLDFQLQ